MFQLMDLGETGPRKPRVTGEPVVLESGLFLRVPERSIGITDFGIYGPPSREYAPAEGLFVGGLDQNVAIAVRAPYVAALAHLTQKDNVWSVADWLVQRFAQREVYLVGGKGQDSAEFVGEARTALLVKGCESISEVVMTDHRLGFRISRDSAKVDHYIVTRSNLGGYGTRFIGQQTL